MVNRSKKLKKYQREWMRKWRKKHPYIKKGRKKHITEEHKRKISKALKGKVPKNIEILKTYFKGKKFSPEHCAALSAAQKERWTIPPSQRGKIPWNYKGASKLQENIRRLYKYRQWRSDVFTRDDFTCQFCNLKGIKLNADHIKKFSMILIENKITTNKEALECEELWNINNGRTLCEPCHRKTDTYGYKGRKKVVDEIIYDGK